MFGNGSCLMSPGQLSGNSERKPAWGDPQVSHFILNVDWAVQGHELKLTQWPTIWFPQFGDSDFQRLCILCSLLLPDLPQYPHSNFTQYPVLWAIRLASVSEPQCTKVNMSSLGILFTFLINVSRQLRPFLITRTTLIVPSYMFKCSWRVCSFFLFYVMVLMRWIN